MDKLSNDVEERLEKERTVWFATVRPNRSPHVTPVWFVFDSGKWWIAIAQRNVKVANIEHEDQVSLALPDPDRPLVAQGRARVRRSDFPHSVSTAFATKYDGWDDSLSISS